METIYKKVIFNKEDNVPSDGEYDTNLGMIEVFSGMWVADELPEWYLEEIELPTEKDVVKFLKEQGKPTVDTDEAWKHYNLYIAKGLLKWFRLLYGMPIKS